MKDVLHHHCRCLFRICGVFFQSPLEFLNFDKDVGEDQTRQLYLITFCKSLRREV